MPLKGTLLFISTALSVIGEHCILSKNMIMTKANARWHNTADIQGLWHFGREQRLLQGKILKIQHTKSIWWLGGHFQSLTPCVNSVCWNRLKTPTAVEERSHNHFKAEFECSHSISPTPSWAFHVKLNVYTRSGQDDIVKQQVRFGI